MSTYVFADDEKPSSAGAPYTPKMTVPRRLAYAAVGTVIGLMSTFPNALTNVNLGTISGSLGLYTAEASWLPALYFGMNASSNLTLVKARAQFGIPLVNQGLLILYAVIAALQLVWPSFPMAVAARIANGIESGALATLSVYYFLVILPVKIRPMALVTGVGLTQFGTPLARLVPVELLSIGHWHGMHWSLGMESLTEEGVGTPALAVMKTQAARGRTPRRAACCKYRDLERMHLLRGRCSYQL